MMPVALSLRKALLTNPGAPSATNSDPEECEDWGTIADPNRTLRRPNPAERMSSDNGPQKILYQFRHGC